MYSTLVTGFYPIRKNQKIETYIELIYNFMNLDANIILFTTHEISEIFRDIRKEKHMIIIEKDFEELYMWKKYKKYWNAQIELDHEKDIHSPELFSVLAEKSIFIEEAIKLNPYNTDYFFWCNIDVFRDKNISDIVVSSLPFNKNVLHDKIVLQSINNIIIDKIWGGHKIGCLRWRDAYERMLLKYFIKKEFAGKDHSIMLSTYFDNPSLAIVLNCTTQICDPWFFFEYLHSDYSGDNVKYQLEPTYIIPYIHPTVNVNIKGGLGNQLFQIATAYAYSQKYNGQLKLFKNKRTSDGRDMYWDSILYRLKPYLVDSLPTTLQYYTEKGPAQYDCLPQLTENGILLDGYFQSSKYFGTESIKQQIKELFKPSKELLENILKKYNSLLKMKQNIVCVHARRTDYLKNQTIIDIHNPQPLEYYIHATEYISKIVENPIYVLISDDVQYWKDNIQNIPQFSKDNTIFIENETDINTLCLMQQFYHFIIANSTFSWWGAWLANSQNVIAPSKWFGPKGPQNYDDIYEKSWIRL